jgi:hypothetical protein
MYILEDPVPDLNEFYNQYKSIQTYNATVSLPLVNSTNHNKIFVSSTTSMSAFSARAVPLCTPPTGRTMTSTSLPHIHVG